jgi:heptosyltransferase-3
LKVVINRTDAIGDTLLTLPVAFEIKRRYPQAHITFLVSQRVAPLLENLPYVDHVWIWAANYSGLTNISRLWRLFREQKPDVFIHIGGKLYPAFVAWLLRVSIRCGLKSRWQTFLFLNQGERQSRSMAMMHESQYNINLLAPLNISYEDSMLQDWHGKLLNCSAQELTTFKISLDAIYTKLNWPRNIPYVVIHPGMSGHTLNWPLINYARLIKRLLRYYPGQLGIFLSHSPADKNTISALKNYLSDLTPELAKNLFYFNGADEGLRHFLMILKNAALFIGPSTGPAHMANMVASRGIYIYSPIKTQSAKRWGPLHRTPETKVMVPDVICGEINKCTGSLCPYYECLPKIEVEEVFKHSENLLHQIDLHARAPEVASTDRTDGDNLENE